MPVETAFGTFIDLLCMDCEGNLVIVELKRDETPRDVVAQALDYGSWVKDLEAEKIREIAANYFKGCGTKRFGCKRRRFNVGLEGYTPTWKFEPL